MLKDTKRQLTRNEVVAFNFIILGISLRMCNIPTPQMTTDDLTLEKKILELSKL